MLGVVGLIVACTASYVLGYGHGRIDVFRRRAAPHELNLRRLGKRR